MLVALLLGVDGCARDGTAVGNPGPTKPPSADGMLRVVADAPPDGVTFSGAELAVVDRVLLACSGSDDVAEVSAIIDILDGEELPLPAGVWCGLQLTLESDALVFSGETDALTFTATLDPQEIFESTSITVDGQTITLRIPTDFLTPTAIEEEAEQESSDVVIGPDDPLAEEGVAALSPTVTDNESATPGLLEDVTPSSANEGTCGCATTGSGGWWLLAGLLALTRRRRSILR